LLQPHLGRLLAACIRHQRQHSTPPTCRPAAAPRRDGAPLPYAEARAYFRQDPALSWAAYVAGCLVVLAHEKGLVFEEGLALLVASDVPEGAPPPPLLLLLLLLLGSPLRCLWPALPGPAEVDGMAC
jgi:hypothetical protein